MQQFLKSFILLCFVFINSILLVVAQDQQNQLALARQFSLAQEYDKSIPLYEQLYAKAPFDKSLYGEYLNDLLGAKLYSNALILVDKMLSIRKNDLTLWADKAYVLELSKENKQAAELYKSILELAPADAYQLKLVADIYQKRGAIDKAIQLYEQARKQMLNEKMFAQELLLLYNANGDISKALAAILDLLELQAQSKDDIKNAIVAVVGNDVKLKNQFEKEIKKRLEGNTSNLLIEIWMWYNIANNSTTNAIAEVEKLDVKNGANGYLLWQLAIILKQGGNNIEALQALEIAQKVNSGNSFGKEIGSMKADVMYELLMYQKPMDPKLAPQVINVYQNLFDLYPQLKSTSQYLDYVRVYAIGLQNIDTAILLIKDMLTMPQLRKDIRSKAKLDLGDYYLINGDRWESTLLYAQVDKDHKEDALADLAKYKNAQLAYFFGDFPWAQEQLKILKSASSDMIANDALYLSILLTENTPLDSNFSPLEQFAKADLLLFQHKSKAALSLLDSIINQYPETPLVDDILMLKAKIAISEGSYETAVGLLESIVQHHGDDVLADDALFQLAQIYELHIKKTDLAVKYYEQIVLLFPNSTFVQIARQKISALQSKAKIG